MIVSRPKLIYTITLVVRIEPSGRGRGACSGLTRSSVAAPVVLMDSKEKNELVIRLDETIITESEQQSHNRAWGRDVSSDV